MSNFFDDQYSQNSGNSKHSKEKTKRDVKPQDDDVSDKVKIKVLKEALKQDRLVKDEQTIKLDALQKRNKELEKECSETTTKYLKLYDENDKLQEFIQGLQCRVTSGTGAKVRTIFNQRQEASEAKLDLSFMQGTDKRDLNTMLKETEMQHEAEL